MRALLKHPITRSIVNTELQFAGDLEGYGLRRTFSYSHTRTPLMFAIQQRKHIDVIGALLEGKADANLKSPLVSAITQSDATLVKLLLDNGADPGLEPCSGGLVDLPLIHINTDDVFRQPLYDTIRKHYKVLSLALSVSLLFFPVSLALC